MDQYTPTGSVSDRRGWEWNRTHGEAGSRESSHPRTFAPARYDSQREHESSQQLEREVEELREELRRREQHRKEIIRQYELCLAEKNRELADAAPSHGSDTLLETFLDSLQK